jgi:antirestriction protein ArdC
MNSKDKTEHTEKSVDVYELVTNRIIELLESNTVPWRKPWTERGLPQNLITKRPYHGINLMMLNALEFEHSLYLTFKQLKTIGGSVKRGEKGQFVVFTKMVEEEVEKDGKKETKKRSMLRYYKVFNIGQCRDIPDAFIPKDKYENTEIADCTAVIDCMPNAPKIVHKKPDAFYVPSEDYINVPKLKTFKEPDEYYGTLFHELVHSTGHTSRLNRKEVMENPKYGSEHYSLEELVAEIGSCYLKSFTGLDIADMNQNASYISSWLNVLKNDKRFILKASSRSQQAVEYILNSKTVEEQETELVTAETM